MMKTHAPLLGNNLDRFQANQVRHATFRIRGSTPVHVASVAAPSAHSSELETQSVLHQPSQPHHTRSDNLSIINLDTSELASEASDLAASQASEHVAKLERAASSGLATTSSASGLAAPNAAYLRRFSGAAGRGADSRPSAGARTDRGGHSSFRTNREFQPREFTSYISNASSFTELTELFEVGRKNDMNAIHVATLWTRLAKLASAPPTISQRDTGPSPQHPDPAALVDFISKLESVTTAELLDGMAPRALANLVWAAAKLKLNTAARSNSSSSSNFFHSATGDAATLVSGKGEDMDAAAVSQRSGSESAPEDALAPSQGQQRSLRVRGGKKALAEAAAAAAVVAAANSRLSSTVVSEALLEAWATAAGRKMSSCNMHDISNMFWALGRLEFQPRGLFMTQLSIALLKELPRADRPQQVSNVLLGMALLRYSPPIKDFWPVMWTAFKRLVLAELSQQQQDRPDVQGITNSLWALSQLFTECSMPPVPTSLVSMAVFRALQCADYLSGQQCQDMFTSLPRLGFKPSDYQASKLLALSLHLLPSCDSQALSNILVSLVQLRVQPRKGWKIAVMKSFEQQLPDAKPEALARFLYAWAHLGMPPPIWMPKVWDKLLLDIDTLAAADVAFLAMGANWQFRILDQQAEGAMQQEQGQQNDIDGASAAQADANISSLSSDAPDGPVAERCPGSEEVRSKGSAHFGDVGAMAPSRQFLLALRDRWEAVGPEAQLQVVSGYRGFVQEFFTALAI